MIKRILTISLISLISLVVLFGLTGYFLLHYISQKTGQPLDYFPSLAKSALSINTSSVQNIMVLGLDRRNDWLEKTETTDTIILTNVKPGRVNLISLPRDLWDWKLGEKINQIYPKSLEARNSFDYIQTNFSELTGQPIDKTVIITTQNLVDLFRLIGGIDVYLDNGFKDEQYPNPEYILHPDPKTPIYTTVEFSSGWVHLDENNITPFVRSRKSAETGVAGGTDLGRIVRQQLVFDALFKKLTSPALYQNTDLIFNLYRFWYTQIQTNISDLDLSLILKSQFHYLSNFKINKITIPAGENAKTDLIYHPQTFINNQWVFIPQQKDYSSFKQFISQSLNGSSN